MHFFAVLFDDDDDDQGYFFFFNKSKSFACKGPKTGRHASWRATIDELIESSQRK